MATDTTIITSGGFKPTTQDTPLDKRTRVQTYADIESIDNPFLGMQIYVIDEDKYYQVRSLASKEIGGIEVVGSAIGSVEPLAKVLKTELAEELQDEFKVKTEYDSETGVLRIL